LLMRKDCWIGDVYTTEDSETGFGVDSYLERL
jgi:hypothetical protein